MIFTVKCNGIFTLCRVCVKGPVNLDCPTLHSPSRDAAQPRTPQRTKTSIMWRPDRRAKNRTMGTGINLGALQECWAFKHHQHTTHCHSQCCHCWTFSRLPPLNRAVFKWLEQRTLVLFCTQTSQVHNCSYRTVHNAVDKGTLCKVSSYIRSLTYMYCMVTLKQWHKESPQIWKWKPSQYHTVIVKETSTKNIYSS